MSEENEVIVKKEAETNREYGCFPEERSTEELINNGLVNINKPKGPTSHQVSDYVKKILGIKKAGHSGTLDPKVTGVLPIALGKATKVLRYLLMLKKEYVGIMHLHKEVSDEELLEAVGCFVGKIKQIPPVRSAVKRRLREREIYYFNILEREGKDVLFRVGCEAGTYIRKLIHDLGKKIGGAHMAELVRTKVGYFDDNNMTTLQDLSDAYYFYKNENNEKLIREIIKPVEYGVKHLKKIWVLDSSVNSLCNGISLKIPGISKLNNNIIKNEVVAVMSLKNELIAVGTALMTSEEMIEKDKGVCVRVERVFMEPGVYPKKS